VGEDELQEVLSTPAVEWNQRQLNIYQKVKKIQAQNFIKSVQHRRAKLVISFSVNFMMPEKEQNAKVLVTDFINNLSLGIKVIEFASAISFIQKRIRK
jgi:TolB-like protein